MIKVLKKAVDLLDLIQLHQPISFKDIQMHTGMNKATLSVILKSMVELQLTHRTATGSFLSGEKIKMLATSNSRTLRAVAKEQASRLSKKFNEMVTVSALENGRRIVLAKIENDRSVTVREDSSSKPGSMFTTGTGMALMAYASKEIRQEYVATNMLRIDLEAMEQTFERIKNNQYIVLQDSNAECLMIAAPVLNCDQLCVCAVGISIPKFRCPENLQTQIVADLHEAGKCICREIANCQA